jgi:hypothetical protein
MRNNLQFGMDSRRTTNFLTRPSVIKYRVVLAPSTATALELPQDVNYVSVVYSYSYGVNVWVDDISGNAATLPASGTFESTTCSKNPGGRFYDVGVIDAATLTKVPRSISFISAVQCEVGVEIWTDGTNNNV